MKKIRLIVIVIVNNIIIKLYYYNKNNIDNVVVLKILKFEILIENLSIYEYRKN